MGKDSDHYGYKMSFVCIGSNGDEVGIKTLRALQMEARDQGRTSPQLEELLKAIDEDNSKLTAAAAAAAGGGAVAPPQGVLVLMRSDLY